MLAVPSFDHSVRGATGDAGVTPLASAQIRPPGNPVVDVPAFADAREIVLRHVHVHELDAAARPVAWNERISVESRSVLFQCDARQVWTIMRLGTRRRMRPYRLPPKALKVAPRC